MMKVVEYDKTLQWVGKFICPSCNKTTYGWQSSGMSMSFPHFYCDTCSNVFHFKKYQEELYHNGPNEDILRRVSGELPSCNCGGKFIIGSSPKCPSCGFAFIFKQSNLESLLNPRMIILDGSCNIRLDGESYIVSIKDEE